MLAACIHTLYLHLLHIQNLHNKSSHIQSHRLRMKSHPFFATNIAFVTTFLVVSPSYYFCFRRRDHKESVIELMMRANDFRHEEEAPPEIDLKEHPFLEEKKKDDDQLRKEFVGRLKERKEWQPNYKESEILEELKEVKSSSSSSR
uniref:Uncharacterized protein n=1 Tax=Ditylum brightwellii TaxID=49249 RepID=A0A6S9ELH2_9STRA|mmetsp:Transcript_11107/g.16595  ORF Transcript_11107/g.16595 Transcript_11107/m.16595 type:complete len:146 (+) Transcript_11107:134-571(+)